MPSGMSAVLPCAIQSARMPEPTLPLSFGIRSRSANDPAALPEPGLCRSMRSIVVVPLQGGGVHVGPESCGFEIGTTIGATYRAAPGRPARATAFAPTCTVLIPKTFAKTVDSGWSNATLIVSFATAFDVMVIALELIDTPFRFA